MTEILIVPKIGARNSDPGLHTIPKLKINPRIIFYQTNLTVVAMRFFGDEHKKVPLG